MDEGTAAGLTVSPLHAGTCSRHLTAVAPQTLSGGGEVMKTDPGRKRDVRED